ncbi:MAG: hypothetical protein H6657_09180 [Ardenticatenaceae bacterium]|nr:hypothetical protein [Ardenticatenaceae bacterium]
MLKTDEESSFSLACFKLSWQYLVVKMAFIHYITLSSLLRTFLRNQKMQVITVATHSQGYFPLLADTCRNNNIELVVLGWGERWKGFGWKLGLLKKHFESVSSNEIVLVLDGFDTILVSHPIQIIH